MLKKYLYPSQNVVLGEYTVLSISVIPKFRQHLLYYLDSFCPILFKFKSHLNSARLVQKIGAEGSVLQELCHFVILTIRCLYALPPHPPTPPPPQYLIILLYNFESFCPILFILTPHHNHQTVPVWQKNRGWRISSDSINILGLFLYKFDSFRLILFKFTPHLDHQRMHV